MACPCTLPRLRQILHRPRAGLGPSLWIDDPGFDIREHVRLHVISAPGDEPALLRVCSELNAPPLDRARPLWEMWLLTGLAGGGAGLLIRLHHAVADGLAAVAMMEALFAPDPAGPTPDVSTWRRQPRPSSRDLVADSLHRRISAAAAGLSQMRHPSAIIARLRLLAWSARTLAQAGQAPRVSINVPVSGHHRLMLVRADLGRVKVVADAHSGTASRVKAQRDRQYMPLARSSRDHGPLTSCLNAAMVRSHRHTSRRTPGLHPVAADRKA
jgi:diacylglycerol O-acyltransferase